MSDLAPTEIKALAKILDELDYYQLIHVSKGATPRQVKEAYYATSRGLPSGRESPPRERAAVRGRQGGQAHHRGLFGAARSAPASGLRSPPRGRLGSADAARRGAGGGGPPGHHERQGHTREGRQYLNLALADLKRKDYLAAERNLRTALTFEPNNELFKEQLAAVRKLTR